jgi:protein-arginine kinase
MKMWYEKEGRDEDVVLSTKACIVRNVKGYNFPSKMDEEAANSLLKQVDSVIDKNYFSGGKATEIINSGDTLKLMKAQVSGRDGSLLLAPDRKAIYFTEDYGLSIAVGNSEHLTIKAQAPGHDIGVYRLAEMAAVELEKKLDIAYSEKHGFLTSSVKLTGTGLKILYTVAIPAIAKTEGGVAALRQRVGQYEWTIYPFAEQGDLNESGVYIIASVSTLGVSEEEILSRGEMLIEDVIRAERACREQLATKKKTQMQDLYGRAYGLLRFASLMSRREALDSICWLRLYRDYADASEFDCKWKMLNTITQEICWEQQRRGEINTQSAQKKRAERIRKILKGDD